MSKGIEIRTTGELLLHGDVVAQVAFTKPFVEGELAGFYWDEHGVDEWGDPLASNEDLEDQISDLEEQVEKLEAALGHAEKALDVVREMVDIALPQFDWAGSVLNAQAISLLNEASLQIDFAKSKIAEALR